MSTNKRYDSRTEEEKTSGCIMGSDGVKRWIVFDSNGDPALHRVDGPALIAQNGTKLWYINGKPHRLDGPAKEWVSEVVEWFFEGQKIDCSSQEEFDKLIKLKVFW